MENDISQEVKKKFTFLTLFSMIFLLLCSNIALLVYIHGQKKNWNMWKEEKRQHQENLKSLTFQAIADWQTELSLFSSLEEAWWLFDSDQKEQALGILRNLKHENFPIVYFFRAILEKHLGFYDTAIDSWTLYLNAMPNSIYARWYRSQIYMLKKEWENARDDLSNILDLRPDFSHAKTLLDNFPSTK